MARTSTMVHNVVAVSVRRTQHVGFHTLQLTFTCADGSVFDLDALSDLPLELIDSPEQPSRRLAAAKNTLEAA